VRIGGQLRLGGGWTAFGSASYEQRKYDGPEPLFFIVREDKQTDVLAGLSYLVRPGITVLGQVAYTDNSSTIPLNDFDRVISSVALRFYF
jgi:outer membrane protein